MLSGFCKSGRQNWARASDGFRDGFKVNWKSFPEAIIPLRYRAARRRKQQTFGSERESERASERVFSKFVAHMHMLLLPSRPAFCRVSV